MANEILHCPSDRLREGLPFPTNVDVCVIDSTGANTITIKSGVDYVILSPTTPVWARIGVAAALPIGAVSAGDGVFYIPGPVEFSVSSGTEISIYGASSNGYMSIASYKR